MIDLEKTDAEKNTETQENDDKHFFVYILRCSDNTFYTGYTDDLEKRLKAHNAAKGAKYTKSRLPVEMVYYEKNLSKSEAMKREWAIKKLSRKDKEKLIADNYKESENCAEINYN